MKRFGIMTAAMMAVAAPLVEAGPGDVTAISVLPSRGAALVVVDVRGAVRVNEYTLSNPARLVVNVEGARLKVPGVVYDGHNRGGIVNIRYSQFTPDVVRIVLDLETMKDYQLEYVDDAIRIELSTDQNFAAWSSGVLRQGEAAVFPVDDPAPIPLPALQSQQPRITVTWDNASVADVVAGFAEFSGRSIILGQLGNAATITIWAEIRDQPWDEAMREVLDANGLIPVEQPSGVIRVESPAVIAARDSLEPRETVIIPVEFKRAASIVPALASIISTRGGSVVADTSTNQLIITDNISRIAADTMLVRQLDVPTPQVSIQAKLIFVDRSDIEQLGVQYDLGNDDQFFNQLVQRPDPSTAEPVDTDGDGVPDALIAAESFPQNVNIIDLGGNSLSAIGNARATLPSSALELIFTTAIGNFNLTTFLNALEEVQLADLQAEPLIATTDNTLAEILVGERTPIRVIDAGAQTGGGQGGEPVASITFEETGIRLQVTPHVTNTGQVLLQILAENSSLRAAATDVGFTFQTQRANNEILVNDGETAVIGGLTVTEVTVAKSGIPFLVDLPIVGRIFGFTNRRENRRDLLILVTPTVVSNPNLNAIR